MSRTSKLTLAIAVAVTAGVVGFVHYRQQEDRFRLHQGVVRDVVRQQKRHIENMTDLQKQIDITKELKNAEAKSNESVYIKPKIVEEEEEEEDTKST